MTTKLGGELEIGDTVRFDPESYTITGFGHGRPFLGATLGRTALVNSEDRDRRFSFITIVDGETYQATKEATA